MFVPPVKSLAPERVSVPTPVLFSVPEPVRVAEIVPAVAVTCDTAIVPPVSVPPLTVTLLASVSALRSKAPPLSVIALEPKASVLDPFRVPAVIVVAPA